MFALSVQKNQTQGEFPRSMKAAIFSGQAQKLQIDEKVHNFGAYFSLRVLVKLLNGLHIAFGFTVKFGHLRHAAIRN